MLHLSWVLKYHLYFNLSSWRKAYLIDDQSLGNNKQSGYVNVHERAEKIVEGIVDKFCLFFSSIKAVSLELGRGVARAKSYRSILCFVSSLLSYKFVNYTVRKFRPLIMKIFKTECFLHSQLLNTHAC